MKIINIGVLAHVDAGKTTLTESLLYNSGAITELGSVDKGTTRTDNTLLERQRGITIQTGITSFQWENHITFRRSPQVRSRLPPAEKKSRPYAASLL